MTIWVELSDYPGYSVSDAGEVRNRHGKLLKDRKAINGTRRINVGSATVMVHNLVAAAFLGPKPRKQTVRWHNGDCTDNRAANIFYGAVERESVRRQARVRRRCSRGHSLDDAPTWGTKNRVCADCAAGKPRVLVLPEVL